MIVKKERGGWFIEAHTSDEQKRLQWLIDSLMAHPDQQAVETGMAGFEQSSIRQIIEEAAAPLR